MALYPQGRNAMMAHARPAHCWGMAHSGPSQYGLAEPVRASP